MKKKKEFVKITVEEHLNDYIDGVAFQLLIAAYTDEPTKDMMECIRTVHFTPDEEARLLIGMVCEVIVATNGYNINVLKKLEAELKKRKFIDEQNHIATWINNNFMSFETNLN